jgi:hypothetical protein
VAVPEEFFRRAFNHLSGDYPAIVVGTKGGVPVFSAYSPEKSDEIRNPELFQKGIRKVVKKGEAVLPELVPIVLRGDAEARRLAIIAMARIGGQGLYALVEMLKKACQAADLVLFNALVSGIQGEYRKGSLLGSDFFELFESGEKHVRVLAVRAAAKLGGSMGIPRLIKLLSDSDETVQEEAHDALCQVTREDMGFDVQRPREEKEAAVLRWAAWWDRRSKGRE